MTTLTEKQLDKLADCIRTCRSYLEVPKGLRVADEEGAVISQVAVRAWMVELEELQFVLDDALGELEEVLR